MCSLGKDSIHNTGTNTTSLTYIEYVARPINMYLGTVALTINIHDNNNKLSNIDFLRNKSMRE